MPLVIKSSERYTSTSSAKSCQIEPCGQSEGQSRQIYRKRNYVIFDTFKAKAREVISVAETGFEAK